MKRELKFKLPNALIGATELSLTARKVGAVLYAYRRGGICVKSVRELARLAELSPSTVQKSVFELERAGFVAIKRSFRFDKERGCLVRDRNLYTLNTSFEGGYTLIPYLFLRQTGLTGSEFVIGLYLYQAAGQRGRAFPSIRRIMTAVGVSNSTVCRALRLLKKLPCFLVQLCRKVNGAFTASSYFVVTVTKMHNRPVCDEQDAVPAENRKKHCLRNFFLSIVRGAAALCKGFERWGVTSNLVHKVRNKITLGFTRGEEQRSILR